VADLVIAVAGAAADQDLAGAVVDLGEGGKEHVFKLI